MHRHGTDIAPLAKTGGPALPLLPVATVERRVAVCIEDRELTVMRNVETMEQQEGGEPVSALPDEVRILTTGVPGLDMILGGGLPRTTFTMVLGAPGSGKTVMAQQLAIHRAHQGDRVIIFTALSESHDRLLAALKAFTFYDPALIGDQVQFHSLQSFLMDDGLNATVSAIVETARSQRSNMVVIDGFRGIASFADSQRDVRSFLYNVRTKLATLGISSMITHEASADTDVGHSALTLADTVIVLRNDLWGWHGRRSLRVQKLRTRQHLDGLHTLTITPNGMTCYPRQETIPVTAAQSMEHGRASFGILELDDMLHGGLPIGTSTIISGSLGTGKTLLTLQYLLEGVKQGEPVLFLAFNESPEQLFQKAATFGLGLRDAIDAGMFTLLARTPAELDADIVVSEVRDVIVKKGIRRLGIDAVTDLDRAILEPGRAYGFCASFVAFLRAHNVTTVAANEIFKLVGPDLDLSGSAFMKTSDNVILLRHLEYRGRMHRIIAVLKMRQSSYDMAIREFRIEDSGPKVLAPMDSGEGLLTGLARVTGGIAPLPDEPDDEQGGA